MLRKQHNDEIKRLKEEHEQVLQKMNANFE